MNVLAGSYIIQMDKEDWYKYGMYTFKIRKTPKGHLGVQFGAGNLFGKYLSRVLLSAPDHLVVDHINGDSLDNRKNNLRLCTQQQNIENSPGTLNRYLPKGVSINGNLYQARIRIDGVELYLGSYNSIKAADEAYKTAAEKYFGQFAFHLSRPGV
jgi:hypothetical protein